MYSYTAYNLQILSEISLPLIEQTSDPTLPTLVIRMMPADTSSQLGAEDKPAICIEMLGTKFHIPSASEIIIETLSPIEPKLLCVFLLGPILAINLRLFGFLVLHASAVTIHNTAVVFLGHPGYGKSTLAQAFVHQGHGFIADDTVAIQVEHERITVPPGFPQSKLWPDTVTALGYNINELPRLHSGVTKRFLQCTQDFCTQTLPLKHIYILQPDDVDNEIQRLSSHTAFLELLRFSRAQSGTPKPQLDRLHFMQCMALVQHIPIYRIRRKNALQHINQVVKLIKDTVDRENI